VPRERGAGPAAPDSSSRPAPQHAPRQRHRTRSPSLDAHLVTQLFEPLVADAVDLAKLLHRREATVFGAPVEDPLGGHLTDARQRLELVGVRGVEPDQFVPAPGRLLAGRTGLRYAGVHARRYGNADVELLPV